MNGIAAGQPALNHTEKTCVDAGSRKLRPGRDRPAAAKVEINVAPAAPAVDPVARRASSHIFGILTG